MCVCAYVHISDEINSFVYNVLNNIEFEKPNKHSLLASLYCLGFEFYYVSPLLPTFLLPPSPFLFSSYITKVIRGIYFIIMLITYIHKIHYC